MTKGTFGTVFSGTGNVVQQSSRFQDLNVGPFLFSDVLAQTVYPQGVIPSVTGMGISEMFPGYGRYLLKHNMSKIKYMPKIIRRTQISICSGRKIFGCRFMRETCHPYFWTALPALAFLLARFTSTFLPLNFAFWKALSSFSS